MPQSTVTTKGQITIPKPVREALGLEPGHRVSFRLRDDGVVEMVPETVDLLSLFGCVPTKVRGITVEAMNRAIEDQASGRLGGQTPPDR